MSNVNAIFELLKSGGESLNQACLLIDSLEDESVKETIRNRISKNWKPPNSWSTANRVLQVAIDDEVLSHSAGIDVWITLLDAGVWSEEQTSNLFIENISMKQLERVLPHFPNLEALGVYAVHRGWGRTRVAPIELSSIPKNIVHCRQLKKLYFEGHSKLTTLDPILRTLKSLENLTCFFPVFRI